MITVVSPRLTLLEVVVMVRVTLQAVSITDKPIARAVSNVRRICFTYFFIVVVFLRVNNYRQLSTIFFAPVVAITAIVIANTVSNLIEVN